MPADPKQLKSIFLAAVEKPTPEERTAFLSDACEGDEELRRPAKELPLRQPRLDYRPDRAEFLRSLTGLEVINDKPAADFWKEVSGK